MTKRPDDQHAFENDFPNVLVNLFFSPNLTASVTSTKQLPNLLFCYFST